MRKKSTPEPRPEIPVWFVTYSDVITLLMTFFILLLTFATNEPEDFERMQLAAFGGGATGIASEKLGAIENDTLLLRERPRSGRLAALGRGSEMPSIYSDPASRSLAKGIAGLEDPETTDPTATHSIQIPLTLVVDRQNKLTPLGFQKLRMFGRQLTRLPIDLTFYVSSDGDVDRALVMAKHLIQAERIAPGRVGIGMRDLSEVAANSVEVLLTRHLEKPSDG